MTTARYTCAKCSAEMKELPRVFAAWPQVRFCPNKECERGGVLVIDVTEEQE